jgi:hypothetical protein
MAVNIGQEDRCGTAVCASFFRNACELRGFF